MDASRAVTQQWGCHLWMKGGYVILVGCGKYLQLEMHQTVYFGASQKMVKDTHTQISLLYSCKIRLLIYEYFVK